jgi:hypothetical protein
MKPRFLEKTKSGGQKSGIGAKKNRRFEKPWYNRAF